MHDLANITATMVEGELSQLHFKLNLKNKAQKAQMDLEGYWRVIEAKTGVLFRAATFWPAVLAGVSDMEQHHAQSFGSHMGAAFQIQDDLLDYLGDPKHTGKAIGRDCIERKLTLPALYHFEKMPADRAVWVSGQCSLNEWVSRFHHTGAFVRAREAGRLHLDQALAHLFYFNASVWRDLLEQWVKEMMPVQ
jgi:octaprenyl-diphosphate synthase